jgi:chromosome segregation ATPase
MIPARRVLTLVLPLAALAACAAPQDCDPRRGDNIFKVSACVMHKDGYQARIDKLNQDLRIVEQDLKDAQDDAAQARARRDTQAARAATLRADLATQRQRSIQLERRIAQAREGTQADRTRLDQLERDVSNLRSQEDALRAAPATPGQEAQIQELRARREAYERQFTDLTQVAPRR